MSGSWDKTLRLVQILYAFANFFYYLYIMYLVYFSFWDMRQLPNQTSLATLQLPERVYCSDMLHPMAVIGLANRHIKVFSN